MGIIKTRSIVLIGAFALALLVLATTAYFGLVRGVPGVNNSWLRPSQPSSSDPARRAAAGRSIEDPAAAPATTPKSRVLRVGFAFAKPPYVIPAQFADIDPYAADHPPLGFEVDIFQAAITRAGYKFKPSFQSLARVTSDLADGNLDAAETSGAPRPGIFYSQSIADYENYAITRKAANITLNAIEDLKPLRFVAWQGASDHLGAAFAAVTRDNPNYFEHFQREAQYQMFADAKADAIVSDKFVFQWWDAQHGKRTGKSQEFTYHAIFPGVNPYYMGFRDKSVRDAFDEQLVRMRESGEIDRIIARYLPAHSPTPPATANAVPVIFGVARPPFVMDQEQRGIAVDLAFEIFRRMNLVVVPMFAVSRRMELELASGSAQIAVEVQKSSPDFHYSDPFICYHNVLASRLADNIAFGNWSDLKNRRVAAWEMAKNDLGKPFADASGGFAKYAEFSNQREQVFQWATGQFDAIIIDRAVLLWYLAALAREFPDLHLPKAADLRLDAIPAGSALEWFVGFRSEALRDQFNQALKEIRQDGTYDRILSLYLPASPPPVGQP